ncbi:MAG: hypothetical protein ACK5Q5_10710 [Planctomycetaceae bacterium]
MSVEQTSPEVEARNHTYSSSVIPWYVRLFWILFWIFVLYYGVTYFLPAIQDELLFKS